MKTKLIAYVTAGAIAAAGLSAAPARADAGNDLARFLIGAAIIGIAIDASKKRDAKIAATRHQHYTPPPQEHVSFKNRPRQCLRQRWTQNGWIKYYSEQCMSDYGWHRHTGQWHTHFYQAYD